MRGRAAWKRPIALSALLVFGVVPLLVAKYVLGDVEFDEWGSPIYPQEVHTGATSSPIFRSIPLGAGDTLTLGVPSTPDEHWRRLPFGAWRFTTDASGPLAGPVEMEIIPDDGALVAIKVNYPPSADLEGLLGRFHETYGTPRYAASFPLTNGVGLERIIWSDGRTSLDVRWRVEDGRRGAFGVFLFEEASLP